MNEQIEKLANYAHESWSGWMDYLFSKSKRNSDGTVTIPKWAVDRWDQQRAERYEDLSESEKCSDRKEAEAIMKIINEYNVISHSKDTKGASATEDRSRSCGATIV